METVFSIAFLKIFEVLRDGLNRDKSIPIIHLVQGGHWSWKNLESPGNQVSPVKTALQN